MYSIELLGVCVYLTLSDVQKLVVGVVKNVWDFLKNKEVSQKSFGSLGGVFFLPEREFQSKCTISVNIHG